MNNVSWEDPPYGDREAYQKLCEESVPSDFYFVAKEDEEGFCMIVIVPKAYFHKEKCMWDQSMFLYHILPDDVSESMESVWENDGDRSVEEIRQDMLARGFQENEDFTGLINGGELY